VNFGTEFKSQSGKITDIVLKQYLNDFHGVETVLHGDSNINQDIAKSTKFSPNLVSFHGYRSFKRTIDKETGQIHDPVIDADFVEFKWVSNGEDPDPKVNLDSIVLIAREIKVKGNTMATGKGFMLQPGNHRAFCFDGSIESGKTVSLRDCTKERTEMIKDKIEVLDYIVHAPPAYDIKYN